MVKNRRKSLVAQLKRVWAGITVEPFIFLFFVGQALNSDAAFPVFYHKVCRSIYPDDASVCAALGRHPEMENRVQAETTTWVTYIEVARFIPTLFSTMFLGSYADHFDTKTPLLIAVTSCVLNMAVYSTIVAWEASHLYWLVVNAGVTSIGGQIATAITCHFAHLAKRIADSSTLTFRYAVLSALGSGTYRMADSPAPLLYKVMSNRGRT